MVLSIRQLVTLMMVNLLVGLLVVKTIKNNNIMKRYAVYDINDEVIDEYDDLMDAQISMEYENGNFIFDNETNTIV
jgi:hypothetical protein